MSIHDSPTLHWICDLPSHYNDFLFRAIHQAGFVRLLVHYRMEFLTSHPWRTPLRLGYSSRVRRTLFGIDWVLLRHAVKDRHARYLLGGWSDPATIVLILFCVVLRRRYALWTDTPNTQKQRHWPFSYARRLLLGFCLRNATAVLGTGTPAIEALSNMGVDRHQLINFPYWIDVQFYERNIPAASNNSLNRPIRFVSSGRVVNSLKGHDIAIRSLGKVFEQLPSLSFEFHIAGTGRDTEVLRKLAEQLGIGDRVKILGWVEPVDLIEVFHNSDALIHPSPVHDPYGVAVIEAMAAGIIVLASDATCAGLDRVKHGVNGFIHRAGNVDALSEQIAWLLTHSERMAAIKREARKTAEQWPLERGVETIKKLMSQCVAS